VPKSKYIDVRLKVRLPAALRNAPPDQLHNFLLGLALDASAYFCDKWNRRDVAVTINLENPTPKFKAFFKKQPRKEN